MGDGRAAMAVIAALRNRDLDGDEDLAIELKAVLGLAQAPVLRDLAIGLDDRRRGRARQWLAGSGLRPIVSAESTSPGRPDLHAVP